MLNSILINKNSPARGYITLLDYYAQICKN